MALAITVDVSGSPEEVDVRAAELIVGQENDRRAALDPPGTPLPVSPLGALATSYEAVLGATLNAAHASYIEQANLKYITDQQRFAAFKRTDDAARAQIDAILAPFIE